MGRLPSHSRSQLGGSIPRAGARVSYRAVCNRLSDIYRLAASIDGEGWSAQLLNALAAVEFGGSQTVTVYVSQEGGSSATATVTLRATSESDPSVTATSRVQLSR